jgi:hypothetical protein
MRHIFHFFMRYLVRDNRQTSIQLHRIAVDDFTIESTGYLDR